MALDQLHLGLDTESTTEMEIAASVAALEKSIAKLLAKQLLSV